jgi:hypothetical protein
MDQLNKIARGDRSFTRVDAPSIDSGPSTGKDTGKGNSASITKGGSAGIVVAALAILLGTLL